MFMHLLKMNFLISVQGLWGFSRFEKVHLLTILMRSLRQIYQTSHLQGPNLVYSQTAILFNHKNYSKMY